MLSLVFAFSALAPWATATTVNFQFQADLQTGQLAGTIFSGSGSYDNQGSTGVGQEFLTLTSLDFTLLGIPFTKAGIAQGGQAILQDGVLSYFTAAFFPPQPPDSASVSDLAFGFGGPGIIGYATLPAPNFGSGVYTSTTEAVPEPPTLALSVLGLWVAGSCYRAGSGGFRDQKSGSNSLRQ
jgi:hypothetical protein